MKRKALSIALALCLLFVAAPVYAIDVVVSDQKLTLDQEPIIENGRTLVPMRAIFEALGCEVLYQEELQTIMAYHEDQNKLVFMGIGLDFVSIMPLDSTLTEYFQQATAEDSLKFLMHQVAIYAKPQDVAPKIINGRTMVPVRSVSESLEAAVFWDQATQSVYVNSTPSLNNQGKTTKTTHPEFQWVVDQYYIPSDPHDPLVGTWRSEGLDYGWEDGYSEYEAYTFISKDSNNNYSAIVSSFENKVGDYSFKSISIGTETVEFEVSTGEVRTKDYKHFYYEGPGRGYQPNIYYLTLQNNQLKQYGLYSLLANKFEAIERPIKYRLN